MAITKNWNKNASILASIIGKTILDIDYIAGGINSSVILKLNNGKKITIRSVSADKSFIDINDN